MGKLILLIVVVTVAIYLVTRLIETRGKLFSAAARARAAQQKPHNRPSGPLGPDDDPDFLRDLNRRRPHDPGDT